MKPFEQLLKGMLGGRRGSRGDAPDSSHTFSAVMGSGAGSLLDLLMGASPLAAALGMRAGRNHYHVRFEHDAESVTFMVGRPEGPASTYRVNAGKGIEVADMVQKDNCVFFGLKGTVVFTGVRKVTRRGGNRVVINVVRKGDERYGILQVEVLVPKGVDCCICNAKEEHHPSAFVPVPVARRLAKLYMTERDAAALMQKKDRLLTDAAAVKRAQQLGFQHVPPGHHVVPKSVVTPPPPAEATGTANDAPAEEPPAEEAPVASEADQQPDDAKKKEPVAVD